MFRAYIQGPTCRDAASQADAAGSMKAQKTFHRSAPDIPAYERYCWKRTCAGDGDVRQWQDRLQSVAREAVMLKAW